MNLTSENYGSVLLEGWLAENRQSWSEYVNHEFVTGLEDGSLPREAFMAYLIQDYIFLMHYSRAWSMAVVKSESADQMRIAAATVNALLNEEIQLHVGICKREGISESDLFDAEEAQENIAYTRYVMDTALSGDLLDLLTALAPCVFGYGHIGLNLKAQTDTSALYREWIDTYHADDYQDLCYEIARYIDQVAAQKLGEQSDQHPRWKGLSKRFDMATRLEVNFWSMGLRLGRES